MSYIEYRLVEHRNPKTTFMESWVYREPRPGEWFVARAAPHAEFKRFQPSPKSPAEPWIPTAVYKAKLPPTLDPLVAADELKKMMKGAKP